MFWKPIFRMVGNCATVRPSPAKSVVGDQLPIIGTRNRCKIYKKEPTHKKEKENWFQHFSPTSNVLSSHRHITVDHYTTTTHITITQGCSGSRTVSKFHLDRSCFGVTIQSHLSTGRQISTLNEWDYLLFGRSRRNCRVRAVFENVLN